MLSICINICHSVYDAMTEHQPINPATEKPGHRFRSGFDEGRPWKPCGLARRRHRLTQEPAGALSLRRSAQQDGCWPCLARTTAARTEYAPPPPNPQSKAEPFLAWPRVTGVNGINFRRYARRVQGLPLCGERGEPTPATPPTPANYDSGAECTLAS